MKAKSEVPTSEQLAVPLTKGMQMLGLKSLSYCYELMKSGELRTFKIGRRRMVTRQCLQEFIDKQQAAASRKKAA